MTAHERYLAGLPPRDKDERAQYAEYRLAARPVKERAVTMTVDLHWRNRAACRAVDADLFFSREDEGRRARALRELRARSVCAACPVTALCLAWANTTGDTYSISGGMTPEERLTAQYAAAGRQQSANTARARKARQRRAALLEAGEKRCTGPCGRMRPLDDFTTSKDWLRGDCRDCRNARYRRQSREAAALDDASADKRETA